jgi:hypothetical protein
MTANKNEASVAQGIRLRTPAALLSTLATIIQHQLTLSVMIWGPPGIGKSSIVAQCASEHGLELVDLRLSQLAPTDLRGLPVPGDGVSHWYPPEFLPRSGAGILFLDEINMAPPVLQGIAQQLILDRKVGSYTVPDGWFVWAAGNRKEDKAAVFDMPAPLANRFIHLDVDADFESFKAYALNTGLDERLLAFLAFRTNLLHKSDGKQPAWPSPRSWEMASKLKSVGLPIEPAVGLAAASEFEAFEKLYGTLPNLDAIAEGKQGVAFPEEPSVRYAMVVGLIMRATDADKASKIVEWAGKAAPAEWFQLLVGDILKRSREMGIGDTVTRKLVANPAVRNSLVNFRDLLLG